MKNFAIGLAMLSLLMMGGCIPLSMHSLATPDTVMFKPEIVGAWQETEENRIWEFQKSDENAYLLRFTEKGKQGEFTARLVDVEGTLFLEIKPNEMDFAHANLYHLHLLPMYSVMKVKQIDPLVIVPIDYEWYSETLKENPKTIEHEWIRWYGDSDNQVALLTASPEEQQDFWNTHKNNPEAFVDPLTMKRIE